MTQKQKENRHNRAQALVDLVEKVEGGYRVASCRDPNVAYFVSKPNGQITCTCPDYERHAQEDPRWYCKHIEACILAHKLGRLNGSSPTPAATPETPVQDLEETPAETEIPVEESGRLEACMSCGLRLPVDELIPVAVVSGFGLVCRQCFGPPSRSCSYCGEEFPVDELSPLDTRFGPRLSCQICREEQTEQAREATEAPSLTGGPHGVGRGPTLADRVAHANEILSSFGPIAIETDQKGYTGFGSQYVIDAVNQALDFNGWKYDLVNHQIEKAGEKAHRAMVLLQLSIRMDDGSWFCRGPVVGGSTNSDGADALKGAITDGLKKAFSQWSIGNRAYRGELKAARA